MSLALISLEIPKHADTTASSLKEATVVFNSLYYLSTTIISLVDISLTATFSLPTLSKF